MKILRKKSKFINKFRKRFSLRFHMSAILIVTICSGILASKVFLNLGLNCLAIRYPIAVLFAYLVFFLCVKLWLIYITPKKAKQTSNSGDWIDPLDFLPTGSGNSTSGINPGGGHFGGGGASSSFTLETTAIDGHINAGTASDGLDSIGEAIGGAFDEEIGFVAILSLLLLAVVAAVIFGSAIYVVYEAPIILSEAAFEGILAASLIKGTKRIESNDWVGSIFSTTWKPFFATLIVALVAGLFLNHYFPGVSRIADLLKSGQQS